MVRLYKLLAFTGLQRTGGSRSRSIYPKALNKQTKFEILTVFLGGGFLIVYRRMLDGRGLGYDESEPLNASVSNRVPYNARLSLPRAAAAAPGRRTVESPGAPARRCLRGQPDWRAGGKRRVGSRARDAPLTDARPLCYLYECAPGETFRARKRRCRRPRKGSAVSAVTSIKVEHTQKVPTPPPLVLPFRELRVDPPPHTHTHAP